MSNNSRKLLKPRFWQLFLQNACKNYHQMCKCINVIGANFANDARQIWSTLANYVMLKKSFTKSNSFIQTYVQHIVSKIILNLFYIYRFCREHFICQYKTTFYIYFWALATNLHYIHTYKSACAVCSNKYYPLICSTLKCTWPGHITPHTHIYISICIFS